MEKIIQTNQITEQQPSEDAVDEIMKGLGLLYTPSTSVDAARDEETCTGTGHPTDFDLEPPPPTDDDKADSGFGLWGDFDSELEAPPPPSDDEEKQSSEGVQASSQYEELHHSVTLAGEADSGFGVWGDWSCFSATEIEEMKNEEGEDTNFMDSFITSVIAQQGSEAQDIDDIFEEEHDPAASYHDPEDDSLGVDDESVGGPTLQDQQPPDVGESTFSQDYGDCCQTIFEDHQKYKREWSTTVPPPIWDVTAFKLLHLLKESGGPLYLYKSIMEWAVSAGLNGAFDVKTAHRLPSRKNALKRASDRHNLGNLTPKTTAVFLPNAKVKVNVTTFEAKAAIQSLLSDPELMKDANLLFPDPDDPFAAPTMWKDIDKKSHTLSDIHTGSRYIETYHAVCVVPGRDILVPVVMFQDKTHTDEKGNLCQEPVLITLGWFNYETRMKASAWRPIGFVPNQAVHPTASKPSEKLSDYHVVMKHILLSLVDLQKLGGIRWKFTYKEKEYDAVLKKPFLCMVGDNEGQDKAAGHYLNRVNVARLCRLCDTPLLESSNPLFKFKLTNQSDITMMIQNKDYEGLRLRSYYYLTHGNAYDDLDYGSATTEMLAQSSPGDLLHTVRKGLLPMWKECLLDEKRSKSGANEVVSTLLQASISRKLTEEETQKIRVFSDGFNKSVETLALYWGRCLQNQSERSLPRTYFAQGITPQTKISAHEEPGTILLLLLVLTSRFGRQHFESRETHQTKKNANKGLLGEIRLSDYIWMGEEMLMYDQICHDDGLTVDFVSNKFQKYIPLMMERFARTLDRQSGMGMNTLKYHLTLHRALDWTRWGCPTNVDAEAGESAHKKIVKAPAGNTQRRGRLLDSQSALHYAENVWIDRAFNEIKDPPTVKHASTPAIGTVFPMGRTCDMTRNGIYLHDRKKPNASNPTPARWVESGLQECVEALFHEFVFPNLSGDTAKLSMFNTCTKNQVLYRADPNHYTEKGIGQGWHDWALADWGSNGLIPAHLLCFVEITGIKDGKSFTVHNSTVGDEGVFAVIHSITGPLLHALKTWEPHIECRLFKRGVKETIVRAHGVSPMLSLIHMDSIHAPCIGVPDMEEDFVSKTLRPTPDLGFIFISPRTEWSEIYQSWIKSAPKSATITRTDKPKEKKKLSRQTRTSPGKRNERPHRNSQMRKYIMIRNAPMVREEPTISWIGPTEGS